MILLKKEANTIFEKNNLPELTVDIQNGFLQIVGRKCGQPLMLINGISPSKKMTKDEREIVLNDYIIPVITTHKKDFDAVISTKRASKILTADMHTAVEKVNKLKNLRVQVNPKHDYNTSKSTLHVVAHLDLPDHYGITTFSSNDISIDSCTYADFARSYKLAQKYLPEIMIIEALVKKVNINDTKSAEAQAKLATVCGW